MAGVEVLVVQGAPVTDAVLDASDAAEARLLRAGGPVNVDVDAVSERGLPLVTTPGKNAEAVAEQTLAFLGHARPRAARGTALPRGRRRVRHDNYEGAHSFGERPAPATSWAWSGYGQVGGAWRSARPRVRDDGARRRPVRRAGDRAAGVGQVETLDELLAAADFVSLHARATADNAASSTPRRSRG